MLLHDHLAFQARGRGETCFARFEGTEISYAQAWERSGRIASALAAAGVGPGARFGVLMRNAPDVLLLIYAASRSGAVPVPLNYRLSPREWVDILDDAGAVAILADPDFAVAYDAVASRDLTRIATGPAPDGWRALDALVEKADPAGPAHRPSPNDVLVQMYTSGTTGRPKGALLTHASVLANLHQNAVATPHKISPGERALVVLPLFHIAAIVTALAAVFGGGCMVIHREVEPGAIARSLAEDQIVVATLVPAVIQFVLTGVAGIADMRFPQLKLLGYGASPIAESVLRRAMEVFGCHFAQGYGMTELSGTCCMLTEADHLAALDGRPELLLSTGKAMPGTEVRVIAPDESVLAPGEVGEIVVRGPQVMAGYWNMPEATEAALAGGWLHTGDAGYVDGDGYLFIRDRVKDMVVSGGENVYPAEVETVLRDHPQVADVAVIDVPDAKWGETVMAVVVAWGDGAAENDLDRFCRARLGGFKVPRRYEFVAALPRNASGKVLKRELRRIYWPADGRQVG